MGNKHLKHYSDDAFDDVVQTRRRNRMNEIDGLSHDVKTLVHEYGWVVVKTCLDLGVRKPNQIRHLVETVLNEFSPTRGSFAAQGIRGDGYGVKLHKSD